MKDKSKKVSIILSAYNAQDTVGNAIQSILNQTYENIELLILNDGSNDNTQKIIETFESEKIKVFKNKKNLGLTKSLNILINNSEGEYIARQDADDVSFKDRLEKQIKLLEDKNLDFCTSRAKNEQTNKTIPRFSNYFSPHLVSKFKNPFIHGTLLIKKSSLLNIGLYDEKFYYAQDYKLFVDMLQNNYKFKIIKHPLYSLNMKNNLSEKFSSEQNYYADCVRKRTIPNKS